jgi:hypothetical protein
MAESALEKIRICTGAKKFSPSKKQGPENRIRDLKSIGGSHLAQLLHSSEPRHSMPCKKIRLFMES